MDYSNEEIALAKSCAIEHGCTWVNFEGVFEGAKIFEVAPRSGYIGKTGYPHFVAVKNGSAWFLEHEECKAITFILPLPLR